MPSHGWEGVTLNQDANEQNPISTFPRTDHAPTYPFAPQEQTSVVGQLCAGHADHIFLKDQYPVAGLFSVEILAWEI
jgi:hypothetical protein